MGLKCNYLQYLDITEHFLSVRWAENGLKQKLQQENEKERQGKEIKKNRTQEVQSIWIRALAKSAALTQHLGLELLLP